MCIWLETFKQLSNGSRDIIVYGVSVINIFTGKSSMFQHETSFYMNITTFDELERYVSIYCPSEVIIISAFESKDINSIIQMIGIQSQIIHLVNTKNVDNKTEIEKVQRCSNQKYTKQILTNFFGEEAYDLCSEFQTYIMATQSFCYLLNFVQEHNSQLVRKIAIPEFNNT
jgi:DNA mismatch repair protein MutS